MSLNFTSLGVRRDFVERLTELGINEPYPIQSATLADTFAGKDLRAVPNGIGQDARLRDTARIESVVGKAAMSLGGLVLAPTRELAAQIAEVIRPLADVADRRVASFYGGTGYKDQLSALKRGVDIAVGCPGRLIDLLERGAINLSGVEVVVIDEADRMADMGFLPPVRQLLGQIQGRHQTMLFSATMSRDVKRLVTDFQHDPVHHVLESATDDIGSRTHEFWRVQREERSTLAAHLISSVESSIVFCRTKRGVDRLVQHLSRYGLDVVAIHGDRSQAQRDRALARFRDRRAQVLVGTDVAARGLHVDDVDCVVHFDPPEDDDTYVHRSGRTGRAGASGRVVSFVTREHERAAIRLQRRFGEGSKLENPPTFEPLALAQNTTREAKGSFASGRGQSSSRTVGQRSSEQSQRQSSSPRGPRRHHHAHSPEERGSSSTRSAPPSPRSRNRQRSRNASRPSAPRRGAA